MATKSKYGDGTKVHVQVQDETWFALKEMAKANNISMNKAINKAIEKYLEGERTERIQIVVSSFTKYRLTAGAKRLNISVNEFINKALSDYFFKLGKERDLPKITSPFVMSNEEPLFEVTEETVSDNINNPDLLTVKEVAEFLNLSVDRVYLMANKGELAYTKFGEKRNSPIRFSKSWLEEYIKNCSV